MEVTKTKMGGEKIRTATFVWMQGEADSKAQNSDVYLASLNGLKKQLEQDLKRTDINYIIGRLSDSGFYRRRDNKRVENPHWEEIRRAQQALQMLRNEHYGSIPMISTEKRTLFI